jgi:hypothetical protein
MNMKVNTIKEELITLILAYKLLLLDTFITLKKVEVDYLIIYLIVLVVKLFIKTNERFEELKKLGGDRLL